MRIPVITGPTAAGKTAAVLALAQIRPIEIISADAYQVYRHMDIGTAKPSKDELAAVRHHMIDVMDPDETYSAGVFFEQAELIIPEILNRGNTPVIAGGTGMYVETLQKGIFAAPDRDAGIRRELEQRAEHEGYESLYRELEAVDPFFAEKIKPADRTRIIRGLEINAQLGMNVADAQRKYHREPAFEYDIFVLSDDRQKIYDRINTRVLTMFEAGWTDEVKNLLDMGYGPEMDSFKAIGYREIAACIAEGVDVSSVTERIQTATRNFAKRQLTWFRHMDIKRSIDLNNEIKPQTLNNLIFT